MNRQGSSSSGASSKRGATTSHNVDPEEDIRFPFKMRRVHWEKYEVKLDETYGLKKKVLDGMGIRLPLTEKIRVRNVNPGVDETHREEVRAIFSLAGRITKVIITELLLEKKKEHCWLIHYEHPLEAVQAVAMFHKQKICGYEVRVTMDQYYGTSLPSGLETIGSGLGSNGLPLPYAPLQIAIQPVKMALRKMNCDLDSEQFSKEFFDFDAEPQPVTEGYKRSYSLRAEEEAEAQEAIITQMKTLKPNIILFVLIDRLKEEQAISKETASSLQEQLMELAEVVAQKTGQNMSDKILKLLQENMQNNQNGQMQNQPPFNQNMPPPSGIQNPLNPFGLPGLPLPSGPQTPFNTFQNQMPMPLFNPALMQQQQMQMKAMQQMNPALAQQAMNNMNMNPAQWAQQQNIMNTALMPPQQNNLNPALLPQPSLNPAIPPQVNPAIIPQHVTSVQPKQTPAPNRAVAKVAGQQSRPVKSQSRSPPVTPAKSKKYTVPPVPYTMWLPKASEPPSNLPPGKRPYAEGAKSDTLNFTELPPSVTGSALHNKVKQIGEVIFCELLGDGRAMVRFKDEDDAEKCFKLFHRSKVDGQVIEVRYSNLN